MKEQVFSVAMFFYTHQCEFRLLFIYTFKKNYNPDTHEIIQGTRCSYMYFIDIIMSSFTIQFIGIKISNMKKEILPYSIISIFNPFHALWRPKSLGFLAIPLQTKARKNVDETLRKNILRYFFNSCLIS